jgi:DUF4097 and DUF4098 domain-containing protein YvlB
MRQIAIGALLACLLHATGAAQQMVRRGASATPDARIRIQNPVGAIRVTGWPRDSLAITAPALEPGRRLVLQGTARQIDVTVEGDTAGFTTDLEVRVPAGARLSVKTVGGEIDIEGLVDSITAVTVSGRLRIGGTAQVVTAESLDGNIEVAADASTATVHSGGGVIVLRGAIGSFEVTSVTGQILAGLTGPVSRGRLESLSGDVSFKGPLEPDGRLEAQSHSGDIDLRLSPTLGATYELDAYGGRIEDDLRPGGPRTLQGSARFVVGDGRASVIVRSFKGTIVLRHQETLGKRE